MTVLVMLIYSFVASRFFNQGFRAVDAALTQGGDHAGPTAYSAKDGFNVGTCFKLEG